MKFGLTILVVLTPVLLGIGVLFWFYLRANATAEDGWTTIAADAAAADAGFSSNGSRTCLKASDDISYMLLQLERRSRKPCNCLCAERFAWRENPAPTDALVSGQAWARFWINSLVPIANN